MSHDNEQLNNLRHSAAHLLAAAVMELWPDAKRTIGPATEDGFYFDFAFSQPISDEDFPAIERKMRQLVQTWKGFEHSELSVEEAKAQYPGNEFKHELIDEIAERGEKLTFYKSGEYTDLCRGGHVEHPSKELRAFKLLSIAGAYWRGSEKNPMLTRIYGTAFPTQAELDEYLKKLEEAKARDHRKLGADLGLFTFSETVGKGLPLWTPKGSTIRRVLERFIVDEEIRRGYLHVYTPDIAKLDLYKKSGHYPYYKDSMYAPIKVEDEEFMLRPMTCPHHFELYSSKPHSYRELPMRIAELAKLYRFEQSGELTGLIRVRSFCLADAHIICADDNQAKDEVKRALDLIEFCAQKFGLKMGENYSYRLSLGDRSNKEKYYDDDASWDIAEQKLREVLEERGATFVEAQGEAAFYGPKIDIQMRNTLGKEDTAFTVQYDFVMPGRFQLKYINDKGEEQQPLVIHRSSIGAIERIIAFLIEHYAGAFPLWIAPTQVVVVPISEDQAEYAQQVVNELRGHDIRVEISNEAERMQNRIRKAEKEKIPYMLILGKSEQADGTVSVRGRGEQNLGVKTISAFVDEFLSNLSE
jgi:threonyl-tRNA synthetase